MHADIIIYDIIVCICIIRMYIHVYIYIRHYIRSIPGHPICDYFRLTFLFGKKRDSQRYNDAYAEIDGEDESAASSLTQLQIPFNHRNSTQFHPIPPNSTQFHPPNRTSPPRRKFMWLSTGNGNYLSCSFARRRFPSRTWTIRRKRKGCGWKVGGGWNRGKGGGSWGGKIGRGRTEL